MREKRPVKSSKDAIARKIQPWSRRDWALGSILLGMVFVAYSPVGWAGLVWDDVVSLTSNPCIVGPLGLKEIWTTQAALDFAPDCDHVLDRACVVWGLAPLPYHLVNVLQHGLCAILLWLVLRELRIPGAWLGAALWALHPVQVESVAWVTEMKNTQSCLFYLLTILFFVKRLRSAKMTRRGATDWNDALVLLFAALAIASKFSTMVLPAVLALCAWWVEGRWNWRTLLKLVPILLMSVVATVVTLWPRTSEISEAAGSEVARGCGWYGWPCRATWSGSTWASCFGLIR